MSFLDDIVDVGSSALGFLTGNSLGASLARTAITGYALNQLTKSINKDNAATQAAQDTGVRLQVQADTDHSIPVVYGTAYLGGIITDAALTNNNGTMYYCLTLSEKTGTLLSTNQPSTVQFGDIYWNDMKLVFGSDGVTVTSTVDREGNPCNNPAGKVRVYCFAGNSDTPVVPRDYTATVTEPAYNIMPGWTSSHDMTDLIFAIVRLDYDAAADVRGIGEFRFQITNSMTLPGDCLLDYMTNTRYGAGIPQEGIKLQ